MDNLSHQSDDDNGDNGSPYEDEFYMDEANSQFDDSDEERQREADKNTDYGNFGKGALNYQSDNEDDVDDGIDVDEDEGNADEVILREDNELKRGSAGDNTTTPKQLLITDYMLLDSNYKRRSETVESSSEETRTHSSKRNPRSNKSKEQKAIQENPAHGIPSTKKQNKRLKNTSKQADQRHTQQQISAESKNANRKAKSIRKRSAQTKAKRLHRINNSRTVSSVNNITHDPSQPTQLSCLSSLSHLSCLANLMKTSN